MNNMKFYQLVGKYLGNDTLVRYVLVLLNYLRFSVYVVWILKYTDRKSTYILESYNTTYDIFQGLLEYSLM